MSFKRAFKAGGLVLRSNGFGQADIFKSGRFSLESAESYHAIPLSTKKATLLHFEENIYQDERHHITRTRHAYSW